jgi:Arc/MetJ-type ribon-helix-helix transcriptional regulator
MYMTLRKTRLTVTVDADLVAAANAAVARGESDSVSAYVNQALTAHTARERRLAAMDEAIAMYEAEFGKITEAEMAAQHEDDLRNAIRVRDGKIFYPDGTIEDADGNVVDADGNIVDER